MSHLQDKMNSSGSYEPKNNGHLLLRVGGEGGGLWFYKIRLEKYTLYYYQSKEYDFDADCNVESMSPFYHSFGDLWYATNEGMSLFEATSPDYVDETITEFLTSQVGHKKSMLNIRKEWLSI
jgi:hypothetical protein